MDWFVSETFKARIDNNEFPVNPSCALFRRADLIPALREGMQLDPGKKFQMFEHSGGVDLWIYLYAARKYSHYGYLPEAKSHFLSSHDALSIICGRASLFEGYTRSRLHFAEQFRGPKVTRLVAARLWLTACNRERHLYSPFTFCRRYCDVNQRILPILQAICELLTKRLKRLLGSS
jgi:hypothetical protein